MDEKKLWEPSKGRIDSANITKFIKSVNERHKLNISTYNELWRWSIDNNYDFWNDVIDFCDIIIETKGERLSNGGRNFWDHRYFPDAKLNFAENLLRRRDDHTAFIFFAEDKETRSMAYSELYDNVAQMAMALKKNGVGVGDRVAGYTANMPETIIAALATISIGAIWCSCSPDFGTNGALDRLKQVSPKILFAVDGYFYKGKIFDNSQKIIEVANEITTLEKLIIIPYIQSDIPHKANCEMTTFGEFKKQGNKDKFVFERFPFNQPIYILFTSGTTGVPKCMVHGAGGTLLQHVKEQKLQCDLKDDDIAFYFTTCSWMMWNWQVSILASGATLLLYEGMPMYPKMDIMFDIADKYKMTFFGTSSKYLDTIYKADIYPMKTHDLSSLRTIGVTGSPLSDETFEFVYNSIKKDVHLNVFAGGGDIVSSFNMGNPISPVYAGEMQGPGLGMDVKVFDDDGKELPAGKQGKLVCATPFVSQPVAFWNDPDNKRLKKAYFEEFPGVWSHGDWIERTKTGGVIISGRADAVLNPGGIRIGTAEIYAQVQKVHEVLECVAVGQKWKNDERVILFVVLRGGGTLNDELVTKIKKVIRENATPRHVPAKVIAVPAIPKTKNGKITEIAVKYTIDGREVKNKNSLEDASVLEYFKNVKELEF